MAGLADVARWNCCFTKKNKDTLFGMYKLAIEDQPYSFLYIDLTSKDINKTFHIRFDKVLKIKDA